MAGPDRCDSPSANVFGAILPAWSVGSSWIARRPKAEIASGAIHRGVLLGARQDGDRWCAEQAVALDIPVEAFQEPVARGREARHMSKLATRREGEGCLARQVEQLLDPFSGDFLDH